VRCSWVWHGQVMHLSMLRSYQFCMKVKPNRRLGRLTASCDVVLRGTLAAQDRKTQTGVLAHLPYIATMPVPQHPHHKQSAICVNSDLLIFLAHPHRNVLELHHYLSKANKMGRMLQASHFR
jgi:hypothetical protein